MLPRGVRASTRIWSRSSFGPALWRNCSTCKAVSVPGFSRKVQSRCSRRPARRSRQSYGATGDRSPTRRSCAGGWLGRLPFAAYPAVVRHRPAPDQDDDADPGGGDVPTRRRGTGEATGGGRPRPPTGAGPAASPIIRGAWLTSARVASRPRRRWSIAWRWRSKARRCRPTPCGRTRSSCRPTTSCPTPANWSGTCTAPVTAW